MCGIFFSACSTYFEERQGNDFADLSKRLQSANAARGPDRQGDYNTSISRPGLCTLILEFYASELQLRGNITVAQPHVKEGDVFCWNGEIFDGIDVSPQDNDGLVLFEQLRNLDTPEQIRDLFGSIEGPYAFVYYQSASQKLFFARDPLGRRSLLLHKPTHASPYLLLASTSAGTDSRYDFEELCTDGIFCLDVTRLHFEESSKHYLACLTLLPRHSQLFPHPFAETARVNTALPFPADGPAIKSLAHIPDNFAAAVNDFFLHLDESVRLRVQDIPQPLVLEGRARVAVLFSGGIDSTVIAFLASRHIPSGEPIDLLNVAFENPRKMKIQKEGNLGALSKKRKQPRKIKNGVEGIENLVSFNVPDRITGLQEVEELRQLCPERIWNFVEVNVPYEESQSFRKIVESLMSPGRTVMDLSLALALYFASRGVGQTRNPATGHPIPYTSTARVLLNGLGSDELLGGYGRHRSAYKSGGWQSVIEELQLDLNRIPTRNMGRDDRIVSSHGKEVRHPFLSLSVLNFLAALQVNLKMDPRLELGLGDKTLLRLVAYKLGLVEASSRKKRAMQFGSHSARMDGERRGDSLLE